MAASENTRVRPGAICCRQPHPWEAAAVGPRAASRASSPHTGATHGGRLRCGWRGGHGSHGAQRGARRSAQVSSLRARRPPTRPRSHKEPRGRSGQPRPRRRLEERRPSGTGLGAPPAGNPLGQPWDEGAEPPCQVPAFTSGDLARLSRRPDPLCHSRVGWPWLTSPSFVWKLI